MGDKMILKRLLAGGLLTGALALGPAAPVFAQSNTGEAVEDVVDAGDDDGDKTGLWGLLGLAGLAGLAGLKRRDRQDDTTRRTNTGATSAAR
jgi:MYXO-CTERM domain-containing protein